MLIPDTTLHGTLGLRFSTVLEVAFVGPSHDPRTDRESERDQMWTIRASPHHHRWMEYAVCVHTVGSIGMKLQLRRVVFVLVPFTLFLAKANSIRATPCLCHVAVCDNVLVWKGARYTSGV